MGEIEPFVEGTRALYAPKTGIVDYRKVADVYSEKVQSLGGEIIFNTEVKSISNGAVRSDGSNYTLETTSGEIDTKYLVNCAGLHSDLIAAMSGVDPGLRIIPFRGEYYTLQKSSEHMVKGLIYPVPDPAFPFLGVHLTQTMKGWVEAGPNAVLALKREGYRKRDFSFTDFGKTVSFPGFWKMSMQSWKVGLWEMNRSLRKGVFLKSLQKLMPSLKKSDLAPGGSGVRAQAVHSDGTLLDDFRIDESATAVHVLNAPSPGRDIIAGDRQLHCRQSGSQFQFVTDTRSRRGRLTAQHQHLSGLERFLDTHQELDGLGTFDDAMIIGDRQVHHRSNCDLTIHDHSSVDDVVHSKNADLRRVQYRRRHHRPENAAIGYRECPSNEVG